jgi:hypothetical protein
VLPISRAWDFAASLGKASEGASPILIDAKG